MSERLDPTNMICPNHSGQEERIRSVAKQMTILIWMIGILTGTILCVGGYLSSQLSNVAQSVAAFNQRMISFDDRLIRLENQYQRLVDYVDRIDQRKISR